MNVIDQLKSVLCDLSGKCCIAGSDEDRATIDRALEALERLEEQQSCDKQEPIAYLDPKGLAKLQNCNGMSIWAESQKIHSDMPEVTAVALTAVYTALPQRKPLTDEQIWQMVNDCVIGGDLHAMKYGRAIEAKHGIKP